MPEDYPKWEKDQDLVLNSLGDYGYVSWGPGGDFDDECFDLFKSGDVITPPIAALYADNTQEVETPPTINSSLLWSRDYKKIEADFRATNLNNESSSDGVLSTQFIPSIKGQYLSLEWDFGDGNVIQSESPVHTYIVTETTSFNVKLTVRGKASISVVEKNGFINVYK